MLEITVLASGSSGNAYLITYEKTNILLDAGISFKKIQELTHFIKIDAILCTHEHQDHCKAVPMALKHGIPVFMPMSMKRLYNSIYAIGCIPMAKCSFLSNVSGIAFNLEHDIDCIGYLIDIADNRICYITDSLYTKYTFPRVTYWMLECNYSKDIIDKNTKDGIVNRFVRNRVIQNHMSLDTVKSILISNDLSRTEAIYLLHLSDFNSDLAEFKREIQSLTGKIVYAK